MNAAEAQFNGVVLLYGYLQRLFVYGKIKSLVGTKPEELKLERLSSHLDSASSVFGNFDRQNGLTKIQKQQMLVALQTIEELMPLTLKVAEEPQLEDQLAVAGAALYAEEYINNGLMHFGKLFNPQVEDRFRQHIPYFQNRVNSINHFVEKAENQKSLAFHETKQLTKWYEDVLANAADTSEDFRQIHQYLHTL
ncbi:hypothetical protein HU147_06030 [Planomicrobium chinense]|uniref:hypothetical protein n=1 Tax=Planococcus chinensis TaxID=272917 RepID=UPI001CC7D35D|nr:hypothetical protein [Planococcus chinensis]MBZ5200770.1 hypothetical protein [Planococcus chinensis]